MKKKHFFAIALFSLIPISAFAVYGGSYDMIVGCGINTIPKFIKASLDMVIKVGIPVASVFLIFAGFMFLTAQGNDTKLTAAKGAFFWSCIGFGVLIGAWLFSTAFVGIMTSITGGSAESITITPCESGGTQSVSTAGGFFWPDPVPLTHSELLSYEKTSKIGKESIENCADFYDLLFLDEKKTNSVPHNTTLSSNNISSLKCSYDSGVISLQKNLNALPEQALLWVEYKDGHSEWIQAGIGEGDSVYSPTALLNSLSKNAQVSTVYNIHTHPYQSQADNNTRYAPPSLTDMILAYRDADDYDQSIFSDKIIASDLVWQYNVDQPNLMHNAIQDIRSKTENFFDGSPEAAKAFSDEYEKLSNHGKILNDKNDLSSYSKSLCTVVLRAGYGDFGTVAQENVNKLKDSISASPLMKYKNAIGGTLGQYGSDYQTSMGEALNASNDLGVLLVAEMHPYSWCPK